jgi:hypothetical protein
MSAAGKPSYDEIYSQDTNVTGKPFGWIQWKGTNVCMDVHCSCGALTHVDAEFFYRFQCPECGSKFAVGQNVLMIPLTDEQASGFDDFVVGE